MAEQTLKDLLEQADLQDKEKEIWGKVYKEITSLQNDPEQLWEKTEASLLSIQVDENNKGPREPFTPWFLEIPVSSKNQAKKFLEDLMPVSVASSSEDKLGIYAPCAFSLIELRHYPEAVGAFWLAQHKEGYDLKSALQKIEEYKRKQFWRPVGELFGKIRQKINEFKAKFAPSFPLKSPLHFYDEGKRFYYHPEASEMWVVSGTPGVIFPDEFYGEAFYKPGMAFALPPRDFTLSNQKTHKAWNKILLKYIKNSRTNGKIPNPIRPYYFREGIWGSTEEGKEIYYFIRKDVFCKSLKEKIEKYKRINQDQQYKQDMELLFSLFSKRIHIYLIDTPEPLRPLYEGYPLYSEGFSFTSARDENLKKITRGFAINLPLVRNTIRALKNAQLGTRWISAAPIVDPSTSLWLSFILYLLSGAMNSIDKKLRKNIRPLENFRASLSTLQTQSKLIVKDLQQLFIECGIMKKQTSYRKLIL